MIVKRIFALLIVIFVGCIQQFVLTSNGDRSWHYQKCLEDYIVNNCTLNGGGYNEQYDINQPIQLRLFGWNCVDNAKYECMWGTIEWFLSNQRDSDKQVPQFYGKWPLVRVLGIQELASTFASLVHFLINLYMFRRLKNEIVDHAKLKYLWMSFALINMNTWVWSMAFHSRDTSFTEKMDYFCAFALVLFQFNSFFIRYFTYNPFSGSNLLKYSIVLSSICYFIYHCYYLSFIHFDYGYNMTVNILFGLSNSICWLVWSFYAYFKKGLKYCWRNIVSILLIDVLMAFEVIELDKPLFWLFDTHALWHLTTISVHFFWYQFFIDDCNYYAKIERLTHID